MAVAGDVTFSQDGANNAKLHPYLIALVRWCVSCLWSTASVVLHRLATVPLPPIAGSKPGSKARQAGTDHLHPEPKVECVVLHTPNDPTLDVIFIHGLYGSLGNTWRQGDWRTKYKLDPTKVPLRNHVPEPCGCQDRQEEPYHNVNFTYETNLNETELNETEINETEINETEINETVSFQQFKGCFDKILPHENSLITENFYNNTLLNVNNYETQANFVTELFKNECNKACDTLKCNSDDNKCKCKTNINDDVNEDKMKVKSCEEGCGCVCDDCYSSCWPRDWIKEDFPGARVISVNYTSDPYLWRPLWVKSCKRLRLHERAEQMIEQLLELRVGQRPIIWVGHSKGGLFIKQIYCEAYDAYIKMNKDVYETNINNNTEDQNTNSDSLDINNVRHQECRRANVEHDLVLDIKQDKLNENINARDSTNNNDEYFNNFSEVYKQNLEERNLNNFRNIEILNYSEDGVTNEYVATDNSKEVANYETSEERNDLIHMSSNDEEDWSARRERASLWRRSAGFMFYSVPHRGSPLAALKLPGAARSVELLEISKDCHLVLDLQDRWLAACRVSPPEVRSLVETGRTLMSVLWLRIVSVDSADAGVGALVGVSLDHREICKPASRRCPLYAELAALVRAALARCTCRATPHA